MKCSLRLCFLSTAFLLVFVMSVLFTYSHHSIAYLDPGGLGGIHRVKLVPGYAGVRRLGHGGLYPRGCACRRCPEDAADTAAAWFDSRYDGRVSPVWTKENMELPPDVQRWWMVSVPAGCGVQSALEAPLGSASSLHPWPPSGSELIYLPRGAGPAFWASFSLFLTFFFLSFPHLQLPSLAHHPVFPPARDPAASPHRQAPHTQRCLGVVGSGLLVPPPA